jgi:phage terminase large subunit-like protein
MSLDVVNVAGLRLTKHPIIHLPTEDEVVGLAQTIGAEKTADVLKRREEKIQAEITDPYRHGYEPDSWADADALLMNGNELLIMGGNRAGKTEYAAKRVMQLLCTRPNSRIWCLHTTSQTSIQMQQAVIWKYMPPEFKNAKKTKVTNIQYSQKNGFTDATFVLPNRSQCFFMNYGQEKKVIEGGEPDLIWCDELVPQDWIETLRYRLVTRSGKMILTFTPITGFTPVVKDYVAGCRIKRTRFADLLPDTQNVPGIPKGHMPYIAECSKGSANVIWFHSILNRYSPFEQIKLALRGRGPYEVKIRAYGWAESLAGSQFPRFGEANIIPADQIPEQGTNYMAVDPAGSRNWFMVWLRIDEHGNKFVYREWPDISMGEWALPAEKPDGRPGPAQKQGAGMGLTEIKEHILTLENGEEIAERYIDPRAAGSPVINKEGGTTLLQLLDEEPCAMYFTPAAGLRLEEGISIINDWFAYDQNQEISAINQPKLFISDECHNLMWCLREWTGLDNEKGASKDPIDALRYIAVMQPDYGGSDSYKAIGGGSY